MKVSIKVNGNLDTTQILRRVAGRAVEAAESRDVLIPLLPAGARHPSVSVFRETHATHANPYVPTGLLCGLPTGQRSPGTWADVHKDAIWFDNSLEDKD